MEFPIRSMTENDVPAADELRRLIGWNQTPEHWRRLLRFEPEGCFVLEKDGRLIGTVTTTTYGRALAWIGMMLVHPDHRRQGIATLLMQKSLEYLQSRSIQCIRLDATPAGLPVYEKLGFISEWTLTRWQRPPGQALSRPKTAGGGVRELHENDWATVEKIDAAAFGTSRTDLAKSFAGESRKVLVWPAQGMVRGWGMLRPGPNADYLGPLVASSPEGMLELAGALLEAAGQAAVFWDVPDTNQPAQAVQSFGFSPVRPLTRMRLGPNSVASDPHTQFAILDPAVG